MSFQYFCDLWEVYIKHVFCILTCESDLGEKHLCGWLTGWNSLFSRFYLKEQMTKSSYSGLGIWHSLSPKWTKRACSSREATSQCLSPLIKLELSSEKLEFGKYLSATGSLKSFQFWWGWLWHHWMCVIFCLLCLYCIMKCVSVWTICITQRTNIF